MRPDAMTIPANVEESGRARPDNPGPVFFVDPRSGALGMRFTARKRNVVWRRSRHGEGGRGASRRAPRRPDGRRDPPRRLPGAHLQQRAARSLRVLRREAGSSIAFAAAIASARDSRRRLAEATIAGRRAAPEAFEPGAADLYRTASLLCGFQGLCGRASRRPLVRAAASRRASRCAWRATSDHVSAVSGRSSIRSSARARSRMSEAARSSGASFSIGRAFAIGWVAP